MCTSSTILKLRWKRSRPHLRSGESNQKSLVMRSHKSIVRGVMCEMIYRFLMSCCKLSKTSSLSLMTTPKRTKWMNSMRILSMSHRLSLIITQIINSYYHDPLMRSWTYCIGTLVRFLIQPWMYFIKVPLIYHCSCPIKRMSVLMRSYLMIRIWRSRKRKLTQKCSSRTTTSLDKVASLMKLQNRIRASKSSLRVTTKTNAATEALSKRTTLSLSQTMRRRWWTTLMKCTKYERAMVIRVKVSLNHWIMWCSEGWLLSSNRMTIRKVTMKRLKCCDLKVHKNQWSLSKGCPSQIHMMWIYQVRLNCTHHLISAR